MNEVIAVKTVAKRQLAYIMLHFQLNTRGVHYPYIVSVGCVVDDDDDDDDDDL